MSNSDEGLSPDPKTLPLVLDLDGTLTPSDATFEQLVALIRQNLLLALISMCLVLHSRTAMKSFIQKHTGTRFVAQMPINEDVLSYAQREIEKGREVHLVTASHQNIADAVGHRFRSFTSVRGSIQKNLKAKRKAAYLKAAFPNGFTYFGDSSADYHVWKQAAAGGLVGQNTSGALAFKKSGVLAEKIFPGRSASLRKWFYLLRAPHWRWNTLLFITLAMNPSVWDVTTLITVVLGFLALSLIASSSYVFNDLLNLEFDRSDPERRNRPLANGDIKIWKGLMAWPFLAGSGLLLSIFLTNMAFLILLCLYLLLAMTHAIVLKSLVPINFIAISLLLSMPIAMGATLASVAVPIWLIVTVFFLFLGLTLTNRIKGV